MNRAYLSGLILIALIGHAHASSDTAWAAHDQQVVEACLAASQLRNSQPVGRPAEFDDSVGYSALLLQGHYPQAHMQNRKGLELCLYDKRQRSAHVSEWDSIISVRKP